MKKLLLLASMAIAGVFSVSAEVDADIRGKYASQGSQVTQITPGNWYFLYNKGRNCYVSQEGNTMYMRNNQDNQADYIAGLLFKVTKEGDNYYIMSGNGKYFSIAWGYQTAVTDTPVAYTIAKITESDNNAFYLKNNSNNSIADGNAVNQLFVGYGNTVPTAINGHNDYRFYSVNFSEIPTRAWNQNIIGHYAHTLNEQFGFVTDASKYTSNKKQSGEGSYEALIDGNYTTYFHSSWGSARTDKTNGIFHNLQADLSEKPAGNFRIFFKKRSQNNDDRPIDITVQGSTDGTNFTDITRINSGMPTNANNIEYLSAVINGGQNTHLRFVVNETGSTASDPDYRIFFTFSEFYILPDNDYVSQLAELINDLNGTNQLPVAELQSKGWAYQDAYAQGRVAMQMTFNHKLDGRLLQSQKVWGLVDDEYSVNAPTFFGDAPATGTFTQGAAPVDIDLEDLRLPFAWTETTENMKWQAIRQHPNWTRWWTYTAVDNETTTVQPANNDLSKINNNINGFTDAELWAFVGNYIDGFKIYNKAAGTENWLYKSGECAVVGKGTTDNIWKPYYDHDFPNTEEYCAFKTESDSRYLNVQGSSIKFWWDNDAGSAATFYSLAQPTLNYYNSHYAGLENVPDGVVGSFSGAANAAAAKDACAADPYDADKQAALIAAINGLSFNMPKHGDIYTIMNSDESSRGAIYYKEGEAYIWATAKNVLPAGSTANQWMVVKNGDETYLYNLAAKKFANAHGTISGSLTGVQYAWLFANVPTDVTFGTTAYPMLTDGSTYRFTIEGGPANDKSRPGMMIIKNLDSPVPSVAGHSNATDGAGFRFTKVGTASAEQLAEATAVLASTAAGDVTAAQAMVADYDADTEIVGHYTPEAVNAFTSALVTADAATGDQRKDALVALAINTLEKSARIALAHEAVYTLRNSDNMHYAVIKGELKQTADAAKEGESTHYWQANVADGKVSFTHTYDPTTDENDPKDPVTIPFTHNGATQFTVAHGAPGVVTLVPYVAPAPTEAPAMRKVEGENSPLTFTITKAPAGANATTTSIAEVESWAERSEVIFDLQGRRLAAPAKGINIIGGRKVLIK